MYGILQLKLLHVMLQLLFLYVLCTFVDYKFLNALLQLTNNFCMRQWIENIFYALLEMTTFVFTLVNNKLYAILQLPKLKHSYNCWFTSALLQIITLVCTIAGVSFYMHYCTIAIDNFCMDYAIDKFCINNWNWQLLYAAQLQ